MSDQPNGAKPANIRIDASDYDQAAKALFHIGQLLSQAADVFRMLAAQQPAPPAPEAKPEKEAQADG